jgi:type VI secretion system protein ImpA
MKVMTTFVPELETLLAAIPGESPAGQWLRYEGVYDRIEEARRADDASLPQGVWKVRLKRADWSLVSELCTEALAHRSKDLQVAAWLLESWLHLHGLVGVRRGLHLVRLICERYWGSFFPAANADEPESRLAPIEWIDDKLSLQLKQYPLTRPSDAPAKGLSFADWEQALHTENAAKRAAKGEAADPEVMTVARFHISASLTPRHDLLEVVAALEGVDEAAAAMEQVVDRNLGAPFSSLRRFRRVLGEMHALARQLVDSSATGSLAPDEPPPAEIRIPEEERPREERTRGNFIRNRADAYHCLNEAADYLMQIEPHSPTAYLIKRAVSWGSLPLPQLLEELVQTPQDLQQIYSLLGVVKK